MPPLVKICLVFVVFFLKICNFCCVLIDANQLLSCQISRGVGHNVRFCIIELTSDDNFIMQN